MGLIYNSAKKCLKRAGGRPPVNEWPDQIPDTPENVARAILNTPPKKDDEWECMKRHRAIVKCCGWG